MTHPHSRAALEKRIGPNFRWYALFTVIVFSNSGVSLERSEIGDAKGVDLL